VNPEAEFDVVVIGGGNAAMCAAVTAAERGARVLVVDSAPAERRGGNSRLTRNIRVMHDGPVAPLPDTYSEDDYWKDLLSVTEGETNEQLARMTIQKSRELIPWMVERGVSFEPAHEKTLGLTRTNAFFQGGGLALMDAHYANAEKLGVTVSYATEVVDVVFDSHSVASISLRNEGRTTVIHPHTVIAACGGFQANLEWLGEYWGGASRNFFVRGTPYNTGRVLRRLLDQGVESAGDPTQCHAVAIDGRAPRFDGGLDSRLDCIPFSIVVNRDAKRFYDEGEELWPKRYAIWGRLVALQKSQIAYSIFDSKSLGLFRTPMYPPIARDTVHDLAQALRLDPAELARTVDQFNAAVMPGTFNREALDDCRTHDLTPAKSHWARRIDTPPYFAYPLRPGITFTYMGVRVDENARVIMSDGNPTENLFACGEIMSGNLLGKGYLAGFGMTLGSVFGRIAGREAAAQTLN
jgi:tricarballylate dehydrogenase